MKKIYILALKGITMRVEMEAGRHRRSVHIMTWGKAKTFIPTGRKSEATLSEICRSLKIKKALR